MPRAGLTRESVTDAGAELVDEVGFARLSMGLLAERLGVKAPSLYRHVANQADLAHLIGVQAMNELADAIRDAIQGRAGRDALVAGAEAMRVYMRDHPGRYAAGNAARLIDHEDPLLPASRRAMASWAAMLRGYQLHPDQEIHALRMLRSMLHGFGTLEQVGSFQVAEPTEASFTWIVDFVDRGLRSMQDEGPDVPPTV